MFVWLKKKNKYSGIPEFLVPLLSFMVTSFLSRAHFAEECGLTFKPGDYLGMFYKKKINIIIIILQLKIIL